MGLGKYWQVVMYVQVGTRRTLKSEKTGGNDTSGAPIKIHVD